MEELRQKFESGPVVVSVGGLRRLVVEARRSSLASAAAAVALGRGPAGSTAPGRRRRRCRRPPRRRRVCQGSLGSPALRGQHKFAGAGHRAAVLSAHPRRRTRGTNQSTHAPSRRDRRPRGSPGAEAAPATGEGQPCSTSSSRPSSRRNPRNSSAKLLF